MQTNSFMLRFLYSYNGNSAHFQGEEAGKSSSRRQEKKPTTLLLKMKMANPYAPATSSLPLEREIYLWARPEGRRFFGVMDYFILGVGFLFIF